MTPEELIQLMRTTRLAQVHMELTRIYKTENEVFELLVVFYKNAAKHSLTGSPE